MTSLLRTAVVPVSLALLFLAALHARAEQKSHAQLVIDVIDGHIIPRLEQLESATSGLASDLKSLCAGPSEATLARVETSFKETVLAWAAIDFLRFGPVSEESRLERFFFWPDPRGFAPRQLSALLAQRDAALLAAGALVSQSVAVQGLSALEIILYDAMKPIDAASEDGRYRCAFASAIGDNLGSIARDILTGWTAPRGWRMKMLTPGSDNPLYKDASETARDLVKALLVGLQIAQERQVVPRLEAATADPPKPVRLPFERSKLTAGYLEQGLKSLQALFDATGLAAYVPAEKEWMKLSIPRAFESLLAEVQTFGPPDPAQPADPEMLMRLRKMRFNLNSLRQIINRELAPAADLTLGFNELDGD